MRWNVRYITPEGVEAKISVEAVTKDAAVQGLKINASRLISVNRDLFFEIRKALLAPRLNAFKQATLMSAVSATAISGQNPDTTFRRYLESDRTLRKKVEQVMSIDGVSAKLRELDFDNQAVVLVETGEKTGQMGQSLRRASRELTFRRRLLGKLKSALIMPSIICLLSLCSLIIMPIYFVPILKSFNGSGLNVQETFATKAMVMISYIATNFWPYALAAAIFIVWQRKPIWSQIYQFGPFAALDEYFKSIRALAFLTLFGPLYERGVEIQRILALQAENTKGGTREVYNYLLAEGSKGRSFAESMLPEHWPSFLIQGIHGFDQATPSAKAEMIASLQELITDRVNILSERISGTLTGIGIALGAMTAIMLALGIYYPIFSASPAS